MDSEPAPRKLKPVPQFPADKRARSKDSIEPEDWAYWMASDESRIHRMQCDEKEAQLKEAEIKAEKRAHTFRFFDLPPEVRNMIYNLIYVSPEPIGSNSEHTYTMKFPHEEFAKWRNLSFARSCRQIYKESSHIFLPNNTFEFFRLFELVNFLEKIGVKGRQQVRKLKLNYREHDPKKAFKSIRMCPNLTHLDIAFEHVDYSDKTGTYCQHFPIIDAKELIFGNLDKIRFGRRTIFGRHASQPLLQKKDVKTLGHYFIFKNGLEAFKRSVAWQEKKDIRDAAKQAVSSS